MNEEYEQEHTLGPSVDPAELHSIDAYIEQDDGTVMVNPQATVLVTDVRSCIVRSPDGEPGIAFQLSGLSGLHGGKEMSITHVASLHAVAQMVGHLIEVAITSGEENAQAFNEIMAKSMERQVRNHQSMKGAGDDLEES